MVDSSVSSLLKENKIQKQISDPRKRLGEPT